MKSEELEDGSKRRGICKYCGEKVRGLKGAANIATHLFTESRICRDGKNLAEFEDE